MNNLYVTVENGTAIIHTSEVDGCLTNIASIAKAIKPMSAKDLTGFYKSLTGKEVKRFASKGDAAIRIHKFIAPAGNGKKSGPKILTSRKKKDAKKAKGIIVQDESNKIKTKRESIKDKTIHVLEHEKKTFQKGSVREKCYKIIMGNVERNKISVLDYLELTYAQEVDHANALACLKKLCQEGQKVQTMELV